MIDNFTKLLEEHKIEGLLDQSALDLIDKVLNKSMSPAERDYVSRAVKDFGQRWFEDKLSKKYTCLSDSLFRLKATRVLKYGGKDYTLNDIPVVWTIPFNGAGEIPEKSELLFKGKPVQENYYVSDKDFKLSVRVPAIPSSVFDKYMESRAFCAELVARSYRDKLMARVLREFPNLHLPHNPDYKMIWAPENFSITDVTPVPKDPALLLDYGKYWFVVNKWDSPDERPLEALIKEFSQGKLL